MQCQDGTDCYRSVLGKTANWLRVWFVQIAQQPSAVTGTTTRNQFILFKKLTVSQHVRKFLIDYLIRKFVAVFTKAHHGLLFLKGRIDLKLSHPYCNIILPPTPRSPRHFLPSVSLLNGTMLATSELAQSASDWVTSITATYTNTTLKISACFLSKMSLYVIWSCPLGSD